MNTDSGKLPVSRRDRESSRLAPESNAPQEPGQRAQFYWLFINLIANLIAINVDAAAMGEHFGVALTARTLFVTPLFLIGLALQQWSSNLALRSFFTAAATVALIATITGFAQFANDAFSSRYLVTAIFILFTAILFSGLRWHPTQVMACIAFPVYAVLAVINARLQIVYMNIDLIFLCGSSAGIALMLRRRQDQQLAEIFAMREIDAARVRELHEANARLARLSNTDALTGLSNRRYLDTLIDDFATSLAPSGSYGVLMIDIDHFKALNDSGGHAEGDRCLRLIAAIIRGGVRSVHDTVIRYGGEEFAMILHDADARETYATAERMRLAVSDLRFPNSALGEGRCVTVSVGAHVAMPADDLTEALAQADKQLYQAKQSGRNRVSMMSDRRSEVTV